MTDPDAPTTRRDPNEWPIRPSPRPALYVAFGIALAGAAAWATVAVQLRLLSRLFVESGVTPTFQGGEQWLTLGFVFQSGLVVLAAFAVTLAIVPPSRYAALRVAGQGRIGVWRHVAIAGAAAFLLSLFMIGWGGTHVILAIHAGHSVTMAILTAWLAAALMNRSLARSAADGAPR